jgi:peptidyl-prolyl cis-trans isomerase A (cyclophilin A)
MSATHATLKTSKGDIRVVLYPDTAPKTVANFVGLATGERAWTDPATNERQERPLYDGTIFHRVIPQFMIQGGDPLGSGRGGPGYSFEDEVDGPYRFDGPGYLAMANSGPDTNGSQFFITEGFGGQVPQLEPRACDSRSGVCGYTRFGQGICGCELVSQIARGGNAQTKLTKVTITGEKPTCK